MTINIRNSVFETNSSSSHSFSLKFLGASNVINDTIVPDSNGQIVFTGGDFTRDEFDLRTALQKANVVATYAIVYGDAELKQKLDTIVKEVTGASEVIYKIRLLAFDGEPPNTFYCPRMNSAYSYYYDSDTEEEYEQDFREIIKDDKLLKSFIFSTTSYVEVGIQES
jgi:hypothetical protein